MSYVLGFERYLRRDLTRYERSIIAPLERMRQRGRAVRAMIVDWSDAEDSRPILCAYLRYLHERVFTFPDAMVMAPTYAEGRQLMGYTKEDASWLKIGSGQAPDSKYGEEGDKLLFKILNSGDFMRGIDASAITGEPEVPQSS